MVMNPSNLLHKKLEMERRYMWEIILILKVSYIWKYILVSNLNRSAWKARPYNERLFTKSHVTEPETLKTEKRGKYSIDSYVLLPKSHVSNSSNK